jgi:hypothetical protein
MLNLDLSQVWENIGEQLMWLEGQLSEQRSRTEKQKGFVKRLQQQAATGGTGAVDPEELQKQEERLEDMSEQLETMEQQYQGLWSQAGNVLKKMTAAGTAAGAAAAAAGTAVVPQGTGEAAGKVAAAGAEAAAKGMVGVMYAGLKFSGLAMRVAQDVVTAVKDDAEKMMKVKRGWGGRQEGGGLTCLAVVVMMATPVACCGAGFYGAGLYGKGRRARQGF